MPAPRQFPAWASQPMGTPLRLAWNQVSDGQSEAPAVASVAPSELSTADDLFVKLDGSTTVIGGDEWRLQVYSVKDEAGVRWIQLGVVGARQYMLTLRVPPGAGPALVCAALAGWLVNPLLPGLAACIS